MEELENNLGKRCLRKLNVQCLDSECSRVYVQCLKARELSDKSLNPCDLYKQHDVEDEQPQVQLHNTLLETNI